LQTAPPLSRLLAGLLLAAVLAVGSGAARAQDPLSSVDNDTQVRAIRFDFEDTHTLDVEVLRTKIATREPQVGLFDRIQQAVGLQAVENAHPLNPIELQKDAVRLTRHFQDNGFPQAEVRYDVAFDSSRNRADVAFLIREGPPRLIEDITFGLPGSGGPAAQLPPELRDEWAAFERETILERGTRFDEFSLVGLQNQTLAWFRSRGYPFAIVGAERFVDESGLRVTIRLKALVGPRARVGSITVEGAEALRPRIVERELPFAPGDRFDAREMTEGQREIFGLGLFQLALVNLTPDQPADSTVDITVSVRRGPSRVLSAFGGYFSEGGVTARGQLTHRNLFGGAQALTLGAEARTGLLGRDGQAASGNAITDLRATLSLRQPYVFDRRLSAAGQVAVQERDDEIEFSRLAEASGTLLYTRSAVQNAAVSLSARYREVLLGQGLRIVDPDRVLNTNSLTGQSAGAGVDATWGRLDNPLQPTRGVVVRPAASLSAGDVPYLRGRLSASAFQPLGRVGLVGRVAVGGLRTLRAASADEVERGQDYLRLRDVLFYAGGTSDVRGWSSARLGPKALSVVQDADGAITGPGDISTVGIGGSAKISASAQVNLPLGRSGRWGTSLFLDAGRVWDPSTVPGDLLRRTGNDADAVLADLLGEETRFRVGAGAGLQYLTPVGFISFAIAAKLNPSYLDLRRASDVLCGGSASADPFVCRGILSPDEAVGYLDAREFGLTFDPEAIEPPTLLGFATQRLQFHLSIGQTF
jgi:outer membrane protein insertion porin family